MNLLEKLYITDQSDCLCMTSYDLTTSDVLEHKWRASLKTILILYE